MGKSKWGWFSADIDTGKVIAKTEERSDRTVHRYPYTEEDDTKAGHGHASYKNMNNFMKDKKAREPRDKNHPDSIGADWYGNG